MWKEKALKTNMRFILFPLTILYWIIIQVRNLFYDLGVLRAVKIDCKVISVGNISSGGTGKTPTTIYLASLLSEKGKKVGILSRGYGRKTSGAIVASDGTGNIEAWETIGDEPFMMAQKLPEVPIVVDSNRVRGGNLLISKFGVDHIILDDGYQHRRLHRETDIVLIQEETKPGVFWSLLPTGFYREPLSSLKRSSAIILSKSNIVSPDTSFIDLLSEFNKPLFQSELRPDPETGMLSDKKVMLLAGIGNPSAFNDLVTRSGIQILGQRFFGDHHKFTSSDMKEIKMMFEMSKADVVLTTEKDFVRLVGLNPEFPVVPFRVNLQCSREEELLNLILS